MRTEPSPSKGNSCDLQCTARCAVPVLLAVAALTWSVIEFTDTKSDAARAQRVAVFNTSVQAWDGRRRAEFDTIVSMAVVAGGFSAPTETTGGNLTKTTDDKNAGFWLRVAETDVHVPDWVPLLHKGSLAVTYEAGWGEATPVLSLTIEQDVEGVRQRYALELPPVAFTRTRTVRTTNWKVCEYTHLGSLSSAGVCYTREVLAALCVTVGRKAAPDAPFGSDRAPATYEVTGGCGHRGFEPDAPHTTYTVLRGPRLVANGGIFTEKTETPFSYTIPVEVRSDQDPVLWAQYLSTGSSRRPFGQGATERKHMAYLMLGLCVVFLGIAGLSLYIHFQCNGGSETTLSDPDGSTWKSVVTGGEDQYESTSVDMRDHFGLQAGVLKRKSNVAKAGIRPPATLKQTAPTSGSVPRGSRQQRLHVPATVPLQAPRKGSAESVSVATQPSFVSTVPQVQGIGSGENNTDFGEIELVMAVSMNTPETAPLSPPAEDADAGTEMTPVAQEVTFEQQQKL